MELVNVLSQIPLPVIAVALLILAIITIVLAYQYAKMQLKGRGIKKDGVKEAKNLRPNYQYMDGWFEYTVTERAFEKLQEQYTISQELLLD